MLIGARPSHRPRIPRVARVVVSSNRECLSDVQIAAFDPGGQGASVEWCKGVAQRLAAGAARPQLVAQLREEGSNELLGLGTVWPEGNPLPESVDPWIREVSSLPYVNMVGRAATYSGCTLCDGAALLGTMAVRSTVELGMMVEPGAAPPAMWAFVGPKNVPSRVAFERLGFVRYPAELTGCGDDFMIRPANRPLPPAPDSYQPAPINEIVVRRTSSFITG